MVVYQFVTRGGNLIGRQVASPRALRQGERFKLNGSEVAVLGVGPESMCQWPREDGLMMNAGFSVVKVATAAELGLPAPLDLTTR